MNIQEVYKKLSDDLVNAFNFFIGNMKLTKLFKATIIEKIDDTVYKVSYKNVEYKVKSYYDLIIGDIVWVCAPGGDWDSLFVQSYSGFLDRIITIDRVVNNLTTDVAGTVLDGRMGNAIKIEIDGIKSSLIQTNTNLSNLNNKFILNSNSKYLAVKQVSYPSTNGNDWVSVSLSQMGITGKKLAEYCAPMACISWDTGNNFWVVYCHQYDDTTLQIRFNTALAGAFRVTLMFGLVDA